jgi:hypothetical protein
MRRDLSGQAGGGERGRNHGARKDQAGHSSTHALGRIPRRPGRRRSRLTLTGARPAPLAPGEENPMTDEPTIPSSAAPRPRRRRAADPAAAGPAPTIEASIPTGIEADPAPAPAAVPRPPAAPAVEFARGAVGGIRAQDVHVRTGMVGGIAGERASVEMGMVGGIAAREASVSQGAVQAVLAQEVRIEQSLVRTIVANRVQAGPTTAIAFVIAGRVDGNARILFDWRGALALGAALGAFLALIRVSRHRA